MYVCMYVYMYIYIYIQIHIMHRHTGYDVEKPPCHPRQSLPQHFGDLAWSALDGELEHPHGQPGTGGHGRRCEDPLKGMLPGKPVG